MMNWKIVLTIFLAAFVIPFAFAMKNSNETASSGTAGGQSPAACVVSNNGETICPQNTTVVVAQPTLTNANPTVASPAASATAGGQSMATLISAPTAVSAEEISAIAPTVTVTPVGIVEPATSTVSAIGTAAAGKTINVEVNNQQITVTPSWSTVVIKDGAVIVNTTELHLENGKMKIGEAIVVATPQEIKAKVNGETKTFDLKNENGKAVYAIQVREERRILGLFPATTDVSAEYDASTGAVIKEVKPWWYAISTAVQPTTAVAPK